MKNARLRGSIGVSRLNKAKSGKGIAMKATSNCDGNFKVLQSDAGR